MQHAHTHLAWEVIYNRNNTSCLWHRQDSTPGFSWTSLRHHDDVIKWKHFPLTGLCAGNSPVTGDAVAPIMTSLLCCWISARNLTGLSMINQYKPDSRPYDERSFNTFDVNTRVTLNHHPWLRNRSDFESKWDKLFLSRNEPRVLQEHIIHQVESRLINQTSYLGSI